MHAWTQTLVLRQPFSSLVQTNSRIDKSSH